MNLWIQGMRRSGTTILYDALREDPMLRCLYEPLREQAESVGGGSGARDEDVFAETRALREAFREQRYPELPIEQFNWGGPRSPELELDPELPPHCAELLASLLGQAANVAIKETRLYCKLGALLALDPEAAFVQVVRDPRSVASSIVLGRGRRQLDRLRDPDGFFSDRKPRKLWSSWAISEQLVRRPEYSSIADPSSVLRVLLVWRESYEQAREQGKRLFGERYLMLRNEDLRTNPASTLERLYSLLGRGAPPSVVAWAADHVRKPEPPYAADDPRWLEEIERAGLASALEDAGYLLAGEGADVSTTLEP